MSAAEAPAVRRPLPRSLPATGAHRAARRWLCAAALAAGTAGGLHVVAAVQHVPADEAAVGFFLLVAAAQLGLAGWLALAAWTGLMPHRRLLVLGVGGTVALLGLFLVSETTTLLDAFAVPAHGGTGHAHAGGSTVLVDPATGLDFSLGMPDDAGGPVAIAGDPVASGHSSEALGIATAAAELLAVAALTGLLPSSWRARTVNALLGLGGLTWLLWFLGVLG
jgi:hypothetical protein